MNILDQREWAELGKTPLPPALSDGERELRLAAIREQRIDELLTARLAGVHVAPTTDDETTP